VTKGVEACENAAGRQAIETAIKDRIRREFSRRGACTILLPAKVATALVHAQNRPTVGATGFAHEWCDCSSAAMSQEAVHAHFRGPELTVYGQRDRMQSHALFSLDSVYLGSILLYVQVDCFEWMTDQGSGY